MTTTPTSVKAADVIDAAANLFGVSIGDILGPRRHRHVVRARQVAMFVCRDLTDLSYPQLGTAFGGRHHTTVLDAVRKIEAGDAATRAQVQLLRTRVAVRGVR